MFRPFVIPTAAALVIGAVGIPASHAAAQTLPGSFGIAGGASSLSSAPTHPHAIAADASSRV